jgi:hypothetical protein
MRRAQSASARLKTTAALASVFASALAPCFTHEVVARDVQTEPASARVEQSKPSGEFQKAAGTPAEAPAAFEFESGGFSYRVVANGNGRRVKGDRVRGYNLHLGSGEEIRRLYFSEYEGDLLLLCEVDGGEAGASVFVTRLEQPSMRTLWRQSAPSDTLDALRRGGSLYLAGAGFVGRLELKSGEYAWRHRDRREDDKDEADRKAEVLIPHGRYSLPDVTGDTVVFMLAQGSDDPKPKTVRVNRKTGRIVSIE